MALFYFSIFLIILLLLLSIVVLFGDLPSNKNSKIHRLHVYLTNHLSTNWSNGVRKLDTRFLNGKLTSPDSIRKLRWLSGWIVPAFYFVIFTESLHLFFKNSFAQIMKLDESQSYNKHLVFIIPIIFTNYAAFFLAVLSDPGYINENRSFKRIDNDSVITFPHDDLIFPLFRECETCKIEKPARSKHCSSCDRCILMFDHHCIWLNNDVAYYTFRWFLLFLVSVCLVFLYGAYLCAYSLNLYLSTSKELSSDVRHMFFILKYWTIIKYTTFSNEVSGILFLLCVLLFPLIGFFLGQVLHSVYLGVTTNEIAKWNYIEYLLEDHLLFKFQPSDNTNPKFLFLSERRQNGIPIFLQLESGALFNSVVGGDLQEIKGWEQLDNIYDKGFMNNLMERLFPKEYSSIIT